MRAITYGIVVTAVLTTAAAAGAQEVAHSFSELRSVAHEGQVVTVADVSGREVAGRVVSLTPTRLVVLEGTRRHVWEEGDLASIRQRRPDALFNGMLIGLAVGAGVGTALGVHAASLSLLETGDSSGDPLALGIGLGGAIGAGVGLVIDAASVDEVVVFQAGPRLGANVRVQPLVTRYVRGLRVAVMF